MQAYLSLILCVALAAGCDAQAISGRAIGGMADVTIIDRDQGRALKPHYYHGEYWVAGQPGTRYAVAIRNPRGERLLAVMSVDGVNVISGETAGWNQTGYVFGPGERYEITGWRKSDTEVADFTFTSLADSYAERTGRPANIGVIGVAVFRERPPLNDAAPPAIASLEPPTPPARAPRAAGLPQNRLSAGSTVGAAAPPANAARAAQLGGMLGTGHGDREYSVVGHTAFERLQEQPNEIIRIHYDSYENLIAMGIIERPRAEHSPADPFPLSTPGEYVPDPPG